MTFGQMQWSRLQFEFALAPRQRHKKSSSFCILSHLPFMCGSGRASRNRDGRKPVCGVTARVVKSVTNPISNSTSEVSCFKPCHVAKITKFQLSASKCCSFAGPFVTIFTAVACPKGTTQPSELSRRTRITTCKTDSTTAEACYNYQAIGSSATIS